MDIFYVCTHFFDFNIFSLLLVFDNNIIVRIDFIRIASLSTATADVTN